MSSKRVNIISLKMVKEKSLLYSNRNVQSPQDGTELFSKPQVPGTETIQKIDYN